MYKYIKDVDTSKYFKLILESKWKTVQSNDRLFYTSMVKIKGTELAFLLKIPPRGNVHRHKDTQREHKTYHLPLETNEFCVNYTYNPDTEEHLEVGKLYEIDRLVEHESWNLGKTDRIHLILECYGLPI